MTLEEHIKYDMAELDKYFGIVSNSIQSEPKWSYLSASARFNMVTDIYGCLEFWLTKVCDYQKSKRQLNLSYKDIRGKNDLSAYNKYLEKVGGIDMAVVNKEYCQLQYLRKVRNVIIHSGAHTEDEKLGNISGIQLAGTLLTVSEVFVQNSRSNAESYLIHAANA